MSFPGFLITGTDTEIGKTFTGATLTLAFTALGRRVTPIKALAAGQEPVDGRWVNEDVATLHAVQRLGLTEAQVGPLQFREPCAPHIAAKLEGRHIEREPLLAAVRATAALGDLALVEGAGGFRIPLAEGWDSADFAVDLGLPVILVVGLRLGCINHALLTAEAIRARGLRLAAWVANTVDPHQPHVADNLQALQAGLAAPCLGHLPRFPAPADPASAVAHLNPAAVAGLLA
ncbi:MAG: dethiobiotin synthase [Proteobacteria bacterium]|jgi:dethiobiotin synthetase|uniref:dethiobiotin synthase n=2 Tax=Pseudomonadota TaxID=1224 RepID=UPI002F32E437|nr:dethiobiotin synthase [Methylibium sp.]MBY0369019.1 dethiobiotin synthase [Burkholderiaceae bacterium]MCH8856781.1 dethiobiotin synthase [Pseudomonadota bacterium]